MATPVVTMDRHKHPTSPSIGRLMASRAIQLLVRPLFVSILAICCVTIVGCNNRTGDGDSTKPVAKSKGTIGISLLTLANPFFKIIGENATSEAKKHGYETIVLSADESVAKQSNQIKDFIVKKVAAIVLSPCDSKSIVPVIQE